MFLSYIPSVSALGSVLLDDTSLNGMTGNDEHQVPSTTVQTTMSCRLVHCSGGYIDPPREVPDLVSRCHPDSEISGLTLINLNPFTKVHGGMNDRKFQDARTYFLYIMLFLVSTQINF
jgi:hypothetical protein